MYRFSIISPAEKELLRRIEISNDIDVSLWRISNVFIPAITILIPIVCLAFFKPSNPGTLITYLNLILNGSIPMIALNRIGGLGIYLFKYDKSKERNYGIIDTAFLRTKLVYWFLVLIAGTVFLYVYQVLHNPFELNFGLLLVILFSIVSVYFSIRVSKHVYLLQDKLIDKTFEQEVMEDSESKGHGENW